MFHRIAPGLTSALLLLLTCGPAAGIDPRQAMPRFNATTLDGTKHNNDSIRAKVLLVQFWTTWCRFCRQDQEVLDALAKEYSGEGLLVLAVNAGESRK